MQLATDDEGRKKQLLEVKGISQQAYDDARIALQSAEADRDNLHAPDRQDRASVRLSAGRSACAK